MSVLVKCRNPYIKEGRWFGCGGCLYCRNTRIAEWSLRGYHELVTQERRAAFITLTYRPGPEFDGQLHKEHPRNFMRALRKRYPDRKLKYIVCGEYGKRTWRPHYHLIVYGVRPCAELYENVRRKWRFGMVNVSMQSVTGHAIEYVMKYLGKTMCSKEEYRLRGLPVPYQSQSNGIGKEWSVKNREKWLSTMDCSYKGVRRPVPRYYIKLVQKEEGLNFTSKCTEYTVMNKPIVKTKYICRPDPTAAMTSKIISRTYKASAERLEKALKLEWVSDEERGDLMALQRQAAFKHVKTMGQKWRKDTAMSERGREKHYESILDRRTVKKPVVAESEVLLSAEFMARREHYARVIERDSTMGLFGKRDRLDEAQLLEEKRRGG